MFSRSTRQKHRQVWRASLVALFSCSLLSTTLILPAVSADRLSFDYGVFGEFYISVSDLEIFAKEGRITPSFAYYSDRFSQEDLAQLRDLLNRRFDVNQVTASIFLDLPIGKELIREISLIIDSPQRISLPALRGAVILAAAKPEGLTILNVLRLYSTKTLKLNTKQITVAVNQGSKLLADTERIFTALENEATNQIETTKSIDANTLVNLEESGGKKWRKESIVIKSFEDRALDSSTAHNDAAASSSASQTGEPKALVHRQAKPDSAPSGLYGRKDLSASERRNGLSRQIEGAVYLPVDTSKPAPLVVIAPGLNTDWQNFAYLAKHLASYGFGVATVNFPGSDAKRIDAVLNGLDIPPADNQWVEQPKVVTLLLDEIERKSKNDSSWQGKLDLQQVGIVGQSLGGYTAMAVAGAKINWKHLQRECVKLQNPEQINLNPSLYLECQGATATPPNTDLQDKRIVAAIAINPVANPVFSREGMSQLDSSLMIVAGDKDLIAPALDEQIKPFSWLPDIDKYLVLVKNSTHFSFIAEKDSNKTELPSQIIGFNRAIARSYLKVLSVAFFESHLAQQDKFESYLTESYVKSISKQPLPINLLRSLEPSQLKQLIEE